MSESDLPLNSSGEPDARVALSVLTNELTRENVAAALSGLGVSSGSIAATLNTCMEHPDPKIKLRAVELVSKILRWIGADGRSAGSGGFGGTIHQQVGLRPNMQRLVTFAETLSPGQRVELFSILEGEDFTTLPGEVIHDATPHA